MLAVRSGAVRTTETEQPTKASQTMKRNDTNPLPNNRLEDVQNDTEGMTRRGVIRTGAILAAGVAGVGAVAADHDEHRPTETDREKAKRLGRTCERDGSREHLPTDDKNHAHTMDLSGREFSAGDGSGTACHTMHIARGHPATVWWHDRVDMTAYGGPDSTAGKPVLEASAAALEEGGTTVLLVAENDQGMVASPDAEHFRGLLPERIKEEASGL